MFLRILLFASFMSFSNLSAANKLNPQLGQRLAPKSEDVPQWLTGPSLGYQVLGLEIRAILGVPGAATLSAPIAPPDSATNIQAAPGHNWLLVMRDDDALAWQPDTATQQILPLANGSADLITFSNSGDALALYWNGTKRLVVYTGLPSNPLLAQDLEGVPWPDEIDQLTLSNGGGTLAGTAGGSEYLLISPSIGTSPLLLYSSGSLGSSAFVGNGTDLLVTDQSAGKVLLLPNPDAQATPLTIFNITNDFGAADLIWGGTTNLIFVGSSDTGIVWIWDVAAGHVTASATVSPLSSLEALRLRGSVLLDSETDSPLSILHYYDMAAHVSWVPAVPRIVMRHR